MTKHRNKEQEVVLINNCVLPDGTYRIKKNIDFTAGLGIAVREYSTDTTVNNNFKDSVFKKNTGYKQFTKEQMNFLYMIRDHVVTSMHFEPNYFENIEQGGLARAHNSFDKNLLSIINEMNEILVV